MGAIGIFALLILVRIAMLQFGQHAKWVGLAERNRVYRKTVPATRGDILSEEGNLLATSQPIYKVAIDPHSIDREDFENFESELDSLSKLLAAKFGDEVYNAEYFRNKFTVNIDTHARYMYLVSAQVTGETCK